jgi:hypothetical protein
MNRPLTALFSALEALLVVGIGIGIPLVPLTVLWATQYGLQIDWVVFWRAAVDVWLLGNGADLRMTLDSATAASSGIPGAATPFLLSIAPLGFALLTLLFGVRAGRRIVETPHPRVGILAAIVAFGILSIAATLSALHPLARPSISQGSLLPTLVFAIGIGIGAAIDARRRESRESRESRDTRNGWIAAQLARWPGELRAVVATSLRGGTAAVAAVTAVAGVLVALLLLGHYAQVITLYEGAHAGVLGGVTLTVGQLAFIPNLVIWAASWLIGPGFAIGTGSSVSALGTSLGPLPAIPILGVLPTGSIAFGFIGLLIPVVAGFLAGVVCRGRLLAVLELSGRVPSSVGSTKGAFGAGLSSADLSTIGGGDAANTGGAFGGFDRVRWLVVTGVGIGIVGGLLFVLLASASAGAAGPGRLVDVGPSPWLVGAFAALEIGVAAIVGLLSGGSRSSK